MKRFLGIFLGILSIALLGVLSGSSYASAVSDYDGIVKIRDPALGISTVCSLDNSNYIDWTYNWSDFVYTDEIQPSHATYIMDARVQLTSSLNAGSGWFVAQVDRYEIVIGIYDPSEVTPQFVTDPNHPMFPNTPILEFVGADPYSNFYTLSIRDFGTAGRSCGEPILMAGGDLSITSLDTPWEFLFIADDIEYPPDYEGEIIPDRFGPDVSIIREIIAPDFTYDYNDKTITATDHVNDLIPEFVPDEGYTSDGPILNWTLWKCSIEYEKGVCKGDREIVDMQWKDLNEGITWTVENYGFYKIEAEYDLKQCYRYSSYPATPDHCFYVSMSAEFGDNYIFERRSKEFHLDGTSGSGDTSLEDCDIMGSCSGTGSITGGMKPCFTSDFPYVDVPGCVTNVFWIVDSLTFSKVTIMDIKSNTLECKQLNTVGAWIHKPGITVCPMFPAHVRDVVTPFVTFAFVLMLAGFLMRLGSDRR